MTTQILLNKRFDYQPLNRESIDGKRHYLLPDGSKAASVTTILDKTKSEETVAALAAWRARLGNDKALLVTKEAAGVGTAMHKMLENYVLGTPKPPGTNLVQKIAYPMAQEIIANGLVNMTEVWGNEVALYYSSLYAGSTDLVGVWRGKEAIVDFKQANRPKKSEYVEDYRMQLVAYGLAHNRMHGTNIRTGVVMLCARSNPIQYQEFVLDESEWDKYESLWWDRVERFYSVVA